MMTLPGACIPTIPFRSASSSSFSANRSMLLLVFSGNWGLPKTGRSRFFKSQQPKRPADTLQCGNCGVARR